MIDKYRTKLVWLGFLMSLVGLVGTFVFPVIFVDSKPPEQVFFFPIVFVVGLFVLVLFDEDSGDEDIKFN